MASSGYLSIDDLEREMIEAHDAYESGYNRQRRNGGGEPPSTAECRMPLSDAMLTAI